MTAPTDDAPAFLHAGLPRTGTTTLQAHLFAKHSQIHYLGVFKGKMGPRRRRKERTLFRDPLVEELMTELLFERPGDPDFPRCLDLWRRVVEQEPAKRTVWSWEGLATDVAEKREARARNLARLVGPARVIVTLRHPVTLVESTYYQILRRNNGRERNPGWRGTVWYETIDDWLDRNWTGELEPLLDYARTVDIYRRCFGRDSVRVLLFEDLARDPAAFVSRVCRFAEVDVEEGVRHTDGRLENSASGGLVERIRRAREQRMGFLTAKLAVALELRGWRRGDRALPTPILGEAGRRRLGERTREGNRWLSGELGLDLARHGYPL